MTMTMMKDLWSLTKDLQKDHDRNDDDDDDLLSC